ncbi:MAG: hypothetical protein ABEJ65_04315, partial [bacterium]
MKLPGWAKQFLGVIFPVLFGLVVVAGVNVHSVSAVDVDIPSWYKQPEQIRGKLTAAGIGQSKHRAVLDALGQMTSILSPNINQMQERMEKTLADRMIRELAYRDFNNINVETMSRWYKNYNAAGGHSSVFQQMVRVTYSHGDTGCRNVLYIEEDAGG